METGTLLGISAVVGYFLTPVVSLVARKKWPSEVMFLIALVLCCIAATVIVSADAGKATLNAWVAAFGAVFGSNQVTYALRLPGAGDERVNEKARNLGRKVGGPPSDEGNIDIMGLLGIVVVVVLIVWLVKAL